jgi:Ca2+-binding RTX toxin-like protein
VLNGGRGKNTVTYADAAGGVTVSLALTGAQATGGAGTDTVLRMSNLIGSESNDDLTGDDGANSLSGGGGQDTLDGGDGADRLAGGADHDRLDGNLGKDRLNGGDGNDTLTGGARYDLLTGATGADTFLFDRVDLVSDRITDLAAGDTVDLHLIDAISATGGDDAFTLVTTFHSVAGEARLDYDAGKDQTLLELDMNGDGASDMTVTLDGDQRGFTGFVL